ncbi:MAG: hypothetical protein K9K78_00715, partial [Spirochaetales bacterium]|nr:hypothetical protein [Spirochaetales bacterium]
AILIAVNAEEQPTEITLDISAITEICSAEQSGFRGQTGKFSIRDLLNPEIPPEHCILRENTLILSIPGNWGCILEIPC